MITAMWVIFSIAVGVCLAIWLVVALKYFDVL